MVDANFKEIDGSGLGHVESKMKMATQGRKFLQTNGGGSTK